MMPHTNLNHHDHLHIQSMFYDKDDSFLRIENVICLLAKEDILVVEPQAVYSFQKQSNNYLYIFENTVISIKTIDKRSSDGEYSGKEP